MTLDTQEKRMSAIGVARPWARTLYPVATPTLNWRGSVGNIYGYNVRSVMVWIVLGSWTPTIASGSFGAVDNLDSLMQGDT